MAARGAGAAAADAGDWFLDAAFAAEGTDYTKTKKIGLCVSKAIRCVTFVMTSV
jgi:hypothetical protein